MGNLDAGQVRGRPETEEGPAGHRATSWGKELVGLLVQSKHRAELDVVADLQLLGTQVAGRDAPCACRCQDYGHSGDACCGKLRAWQDTGNLLRRADGRVELICWHCAADLRDSLHRRASLDFLRGDEKPELTTIHEVSFRLAFLMWRMAGDAAGDDLMAEIAAFVNAVQETAEAIDARARNKELGDDGVPRSV